MTIDEKRAAIVAKIMSSAELVDGCQLHSYENDRGEKIYQGVFNITEDDGIDIVTSIPGDAENALFVALSDRARSMARRIVANLGQWSAMGRVQMGNVVLIDDPELLSSGFCGVVLLPASVSNALRSFPPLLDVGERSLPIVLAVPISDAEHQVWKRQGHDALMSLFGDSDKQLVFVADQKTMDS